VNDRSEGTGGAVRITAQVLDTASGRPVGVLKSTGSIDDLFPVEDELAEQARAAFGRIEYASRLETDHGGAADSAGSGEPRPTIEPYGPVTMRAYGTPDWAAVNGSNIPVAASNRYYFGNPYGWFEIVPTPTYVAPTPGYGGGYYGGGGSVSYSVSRFPVSFSGNNTPGNGMTPGTVVPRFMSEGPLPGVRLPTGPLVGPNPTPAAGPVPNQMGVANPRSFPGHVFHGKTYGQTLGTQK